MPVRESYALTVTFRPHIKYSEQLKLIAKFKSIVRDELKLFYSFKLVWSIEYHKYQPPHFKVGKPNPMRPHLHALLQVEEELSQKYINSLFMKFTKRFGRTQFDQIHSEEDFTNWYTYIKKDVQQNNIDYAPINHWYEYEHDLQKYMERIESHTRTVTDFDGDGIGCYLSEEEDS